MEFKDICEKYLDGRVKIIDGNVACHISGLDIIHIGDDFNIDAVFASCNDIERVEDRVKTSIIRYIDDNYEKGIPETPISDNSEVIKNLIKIENKLSRLFYKKYEEQLRLRLI